MYQYKKYSNELKIQTSLKQENMEQKSALTVKVFRLLMLELLI